MLMSKFIRLVNRHFRHLIGNKVSLTQFLLPNDRLVFFDHFPPLVIVIVIAVFSPFFCIYPILFEYQLPFTRQLLPRYSFLLFLCSFVCVLLFSHMSEKKIYLLFSESTPSALQRKRHPSGNRNNKRGI